MKNLLLAFIALYLVDAESQNVSTFMETTSSGCYGLTIDDNFLYVVSSFDGKVHRKSLATDSTTFETFSIGGSGYQGICKVGNFVYISKPFNGAYGIYRFDPNAENIILEYFLNLNNAYGLAHKDTELYVSGADKIYKVDLNSSSPTLITIADNISGVGDLNGSTIGLKVFENYLYISESTGISKINLISGNYEKEIVTGFTGTSFTLGNNDKIYLTGGEEYTGVYELDLPTQNYTLLTQIDNFIGTYDIIYFNESLFVTTQEGDYNKVARIDLENLNTTNIEPNISRIFPNPVADYINLVDVEPFESVTIINEHGQVKVVKVDNKRINVTDLSSGIYFIKTKGWSQKFIKK